MHDYEIVTDTRSPSVMWIAVLLVGAAAIVLLPMGPAILLAAWTASFSRGLHRRIARVLGGRLRLAAILTVTMLGLVLVPVGLLLGSVATDAYQLVKQLFASEQGKDLLSKLVKNGGGRDPVDALIEQREQAWSLVQTIAGTATRAAIGLFVFIAGTYAFLVDGKRWFQWARRHTPLPHSAIDRLVSAFYETGRGLLVGIGGAGLLQAIVATIAFFVLGVPHAFALGLLTLCASVFPAVGSALVWVPVAVGLAVTGRTTAAIGLGVVGVGVISSIDNLIRPILARRGHLKLPSFIVLVAMFGGVAIFGGWGILIGPLVVRLAKEAIEIRTDMRKAAASTT